MLKYNTIQFHISSYFNTSIIIPFHCLYYISAYTDDVGFGDFFSLHPSLYSPALAVLIILFDCNPLVCYYIIILLFHCFIDPSTLHHRRIQHHHKLALKSSTLAKIVSSVNTVDSLTLASLKLASSTLAKIVA